MNAGISEPFFTQNILDNIKRRILGLIVLFLVCQPSFSKPNVDFWWSGGVTMSFGTHVNRLGLFVAASYSYEFVQCNGRLSATYNVTSYGTREKTPEFQAGSGIVIADSKTKDSSLIPFDLVCNNTGFKRSIGYAYNYYFDKTGTSQPTGFVGLQLGRFRLVTENDILGHGHEDKYRTAACLISYQTNDDVVYSLKTILWTGDSFDRNAVKVTGSNYPARFGYKNLKDARWGRHSVGILCLQAERIVDLSTDNTVKIMAGIDAERIRHIFQNKFMHDEYFFPSSWIKYKNMHYPMLQEDGSPFLFEDSQKVRKHRVFINGATNDNLFY